MADSYQAARAELTSSGSTTLQPSIAIWTFLRWLVLVPVAVSVAGAVAILLTESSPGFALAMLPMLAMLGGLWYWLGRVREQQRRPIELSAAGIAVRGVGPVPWQHLMPPEVQWQRDQHDSGHKRVPVMPFTAQGLEYTQHGLPAHQRQQLSGRGTLTSPPPPVVRLPETITGLSRDEYLSLLAEAHAHFGQLR